MLIGVSGSGKQTLTKLAASTLEHECFQIKLSKSFTPFDFRELLKEKMLPSGCDAKDTTFVLNDTQIMYESFLEDVNNILNTGEITNLYSKDDYEKMNESLTKLLNRKKVPVNKDNIYDEYIE
jgi:dynein heavy chain